MVSHMGSSAAAAKGLCPSILGAELQGSIGAGGSDPTTAPENNSQLAEKQECLFSVKLKTALKVEKIFSFRTKQKL